MPGSKGPPTSHLLVEQAFDVEDAAFLDLLCGLAEPEFHARFAARWLADPRPWARDRIFEYLARPLAHRGHEPLVKRLFKGAEAAGDDAFIAAFVVAFVVAPDHGLLAGWLQGRRGKHHVHHYHPVDEEVG